MVVGWKAAPLKFQWLTTSCWSLVPYLSVLLGEVIAHFITPVAWVYLIIFTCFSQQDLRIS